MKQHHTTVHASAQVSKLGGFTHFLVNPYLSKCLHDDKILLKKVKDIGFPQTELVN